MHTKGTVGMVIMVEWHTALNRWKVNLTDGHNEPVSHSEFSLHAFWNTSQLFDVQEEVKTYPNN